jgi:Acetyltransferase (GNAT) domain
MKDVVWQERGARAAEVVALQEACIVSPAPRDIWRRTLAADPNAVATQTPEWLDCLCRARGYVDASRLYELPDGRIMVLPLAAKVLAGVRVAEESWPHGWGYGGAVVAGGEVTAADARLVLTDLARRRVVRSAVVPMPLVGGVWEQAAPRYAQRVPYLTQILNLEGGFDTVWSKRYRRQVRASVRKAERFSLEVRRDHGGNAVDVFAELHRQSVDRWARQRGQPLRVARLLARWRNFAGRVAAASAALGDACVIWSVFRAGEAVAVNVVLQFGQHNMGWLSVTNRELANETGATYLLHSRTIEDACRSGVRQFHLGESDPGSPVEHYKAQFGATPVKYQALRLERLPVTRAERRLRATAEQVFRLAGTRRVT